MNDADPAPSLEQQYAAIFSREPAPPDPDASGEFFAHAAEARRVLERHLSDPSSPLYGRSEALQNHDDAVARVVARHGLVEPRAETPAERAQREFFEGWDRGATINPGLAKMIEVELEREERLMPHEIAARRAELIEEHGLRGYEALVEQARAAVALGAWRESVASNRAALGLLSAQGRFIASMQREAERRGYRR